MINGPTKFSIIQIAKTNSFRISEINAYIKFSVDNLDIHNEFKAEQQHQG